MPFQHSVTLGSDMTLEQIAESTGWPNPGPIVSFPANQSLFNFSPTLQSVLPKGTKLWIPWKEDSLQRMIQTCQSIILWTAQYAEKEVEQAKARNEEYENFVGTVDVISIIATTLATLGISAANLIRGGAEGAAQGATEMSEEEFLKWQREAVKDFALDRINTGLTVGGLAFGVQKPKLDTAGDWARLVLRHATGPLTPSWYASIYAAIAEDDADIYIFGSSEMLYREVSKIQAEANKTINDQQIIMREADAQLKMDFYKQTI